jgi:hypothetical protein
MLTSDAHNTDVYNAELTGTIRRLTCTILTSGILTPFGHNTDTMLTCILKCSMDVHHLMT